jgi:hypothetical protein
MQLTLRHEVVRTLYYAAPVAPEDIERPAETELTRAARHSVENANQIVTAEAEFEEADFTKRATVQQQKKKVNGQRKKARKTERKRKANARRRK